MVLHDSHSVLLQVRFVDYVDSLQVDCRHVGDCVFFIVFVSFGFVPHIVMRSLPCDELVSRVIS